MTRGKNTHCGKGSGEKKINARMSPGIPNQPDSFPRQKFVIRDCRSFHILILFFFSSLIPPPDKSSLHEIAALSVFLFTRILFFLLV
jgi:hypothetical protein